MHAFLFENFINAFESFSIPKKNKILLYKAKYVWLVKIVFEKSHGVKGQPKCCDNI